MNFRHWLYLMFILCLCNCKYDKDDLTDIGLGDYTAEFAIPLFQANITLDETLSNVEENTTMIIDPDGLIRLKYKGDFIGRNADDIFNFITTLLPIEVSDTVVHASYDIPGSIDIDFLNLSGGALSTAFDSPFEEDIKVSMSIPQLTKNGVEYTRDFDVKYDGEAPTNASLIGVSMNGYVISPQDEKLLTVRYVATKASGERVKMDNFVVFFTSLEYDYAEGFLGTDVYTVAADTIEIDFFKNWANGSVYFEDPKISLTVFNSFGFPIDGKFVYIDILTVNEDVLTLESDFIDEGIYVDYPALSEVGGMANTVFNFDKENSNIREVLGAGPLALYYDLEGIPNPDIDTSIRGFMTDSSEMRVQVEVELPIHGYADHFEVRDTFDVDFGNFQDSDAEYAEFKLVSENGTPLGVDLQLYFTDEEYNFIDSLLTPQQTVIAPAEVNSEGEATMDSKKVILQEFNSDRFEKLKSAKKIVLLSSFSTTNYMNSQSIKILAEQELSIRMGMKVGLKN